MVTQHIQQDWSSTNSVKKRRTAESGSGAGRCCEEVAVALFVFVCPVSHLCFTSRQCILPQKNTLGCIPSNNSITHSSSVILTFTNTHTHLFQQFTLFTCYMIGKKTDGNWSWCAINRSDFVIQIQFSSITASVFINYETALKAALQLSLEEIIWLKIKHRACLMYISLINSLGNSHWIQLFLKKQLKTQRIHNYKQSLFLFFSAFHFCISFYFKPAIVCVYKLLE